MRRQGTDLARVNPQQMLEQPAAAFSNRGDALDRVLHKGIVIDAWIRASPGGIDLLTHSARMLVASMETHLRYADLFPEVPVASFQGVQRGRLGLPIRDP